MEFLKYLYYNIGTVVLSLHDTSRRVYISDDSNLMVKKAYYICVECSRVVVIRCTYLKTRFTYVHSREWRSKLIIH